jgi:UDP-N-acetylmuramoyl-L-alanyl-D-glutamate--2,6-diaminopimelate ligase
MNKKEILETLNKFITTKNNQGSSDVLINDITTNLQSATNNSVVFYKVQDTDSGREAFKKRLGNLNPALIILNKGAEFIKNENCIFVDTNQFLLIQKTLCDLVFPNKNQLKLVGVTGTNGKTTTVNLGMQVSTVLGMPAISVGTIGIFDMNGAINEDLEATTPSYVELRKIIFKYQDKYKAAFIEISSHGLYQDRLFDLRLDQAAWTSFSQDHLDFHKTMDEYFKAKLLIERKYLKEGSVLLLPPEESEMNSKIQKDSPNTKFKIVKTLKELGIVKYPLFYHSSYNQSNVQLALALNESLWNKDISKFDLEKIKTPKGRFSVIEIGETSMAIIDYAHTPDALVNIGAAIKAAFPKHKIIALFGCGGNRDKTKRPLMGKAVSAFADKIMITSDNPRDESPEDIIVDIIPGLTKDYEAMLDRKQAIITCLDDMEEGEILLIAGKGHEEYQEIKGVKHPFSDFDIVEEYKRELEKDIE